jgi:hypothetical protein
MRAEGEPAAMPDDPRTQHWMNRDRASEEANLRLNALFDVLEEMCGVMARRLGHLPDQEVHVFGALIGAYMEALWEADLQGEPWPLPPEHVFSLAVAYRATAAHYLALELGPTPNERMSVAVEEAVSVLSDALLLEAAAPPPPDLFAR